MPTDPRAITAMVDCLLRLIAEFAKEEKPTGMTSFPNSEWHILDAGNFTLIYKREETIAAIEDIRKKFARKDWRAKWSPSYIREVETALIGAAFNDKDPENIAKAATEAAAILDGEAPEYVVILPIGRLYLGDLEVAFLDIELKTLNQQRLDDIRQRYYDIVATTPHTDEEKTKLYEDVDERTELLLNRPCAFITVRGDKALAQERAAKKLEPVIDFLQLITSIQEHSFKKIRIHVGGDLLTKQPISLMIATDGSSIHDQGRHLFDFRFELKQEHLDKMRDAGFGSLIDALNKVETDRTEFEQILLRSMHWIADAERQELSENKITSYITAVDMFFSSKGGPATRDVTEGTAFVLGSTLEHRRQIVERVDGFYEMRSRVSHGGEPIEDEDIARRVKLLAINLLAKLSEMSSQFETRAAFRSWLVDCRLTPGASEPSSTAEEPPDNVA